ncbi:uncharacterized protein CLUP02_05950 [Colletotrichum lupini]|uniref:Tat pathway signal sequence n=1 Tax=Colletotrichum lupini TaxID=145971 RepID=A0A9Q8WF36_9PEZI|nr:uncharacterized protein CLUP02_05950 [Colletotrichum lupini]UQC80467.1 hypothetical protein CLUP02_05950 [Colletotrichum lupini]
MILGREVSSRQGLLSADGTSILYPSIMNTPQELILPPLCRYSDLQAWVWVWWMLVLPEGNGEPSFDNRSRPTAWAVFVLPPLPDLTDAGLFVLEAPFRVSCLSQPQTREYLDVLFAATPRLAHFRNLHTMSSLSEDAKPFLPSENGDSSFDLAPAERSRLRQDRSTESRWRRRLWVSHVIFLGFNVAFLIYNISDVGKHIGPEAAVLERAYSPAQMAIRYTVKEEAPMLPDNVLTGPPGPEADKAFSEDEMNRMQKTSLALKDGSGYIGYLESFHMLHCVKSAWKSQYMDHYGSGHSTKPGHLAHCLNKEGGTIKGKEIMDIEANRTGHRQCTDFSKLQAWATKRTLDFDVHDTDKFLRTLKPEH